MTNICGLPVYCGTTEEFYGLLKRRLSSAQGFWLVTLNVEMVAQAQRSRLYEDLIKQADFFVPDGFPIVLFSKLKTQAGIKAANYERITGVDLCQRILEDSEIERCAIIGGLNPHAALAKLSLTSSRRFYVYAEQITNTASFCSQQNATLEAFRPQVILLALGIPKQDELAKELRKKFPAAIIIGVGGALDFISGLKKRAPSWMQKFGLEWLYRLATEPRRLWRRYLLLYPIGVGGLIKDFSRRE